MKYYIVKKLDAADSAQVTNIVERIRSVANAVKWEEVPYLQMDDAELIIAVGGDGTMLHAMRYSIDVSAPAICFNIGKLGFLAEFEPNQIEETIIAIENNKYRIESRSLLYENVFNVRAINEFVIAPVLSKNTIKYEFFINGVSSGMHKANGLIIATPTGSTAYSLSVGGAIMDPNAEVFQITPIAAMSLNSRSVIVSENSSISVNLYLQEHVKYNLIADGQVVAQIDNVDEGGGDSYTPPIKKIYHTFNFRKNEQLAQIIHGNNWNFFEVLHKKLGWNSAI